MDSKFLRAEQQFMEADELIKDKKIEQAMDLLYEIVDAYPDFGRAYNHLGWIYETKLSNLQKAEECYKLAIQYDPNYRPSYYNYAIVLSVSKRFKELDELLIRAQSIAGIDMATIHNEYAIMHEAQGYYDLAIDHYRKYIAAAFNDTSIQNALAAIERCRKKQDILGRY